MAADVIHAAPPELVLTVQRRFRVMGSDAQVIVVDGPPGLLDVAELHLRHLEQRWSRFLPTSDISRANANAGRPTAASTDTVLLVARAVAAWELTDHAFDPTILGDLERAGYTASFDTGATRPADSPRHRGCGSITWTDTMVTLPGGVGFDPGGIGKGLAADLTIDLLLGAGAAGAGVNVGGDLRVAGRGPRGAEWTVSIDPPDPAAAPLVKVGLTAGAVATSTTKRRAWTVDGERRHHVIDPATGRPARSSFVQATAISGEAWLAEALATQVLLAGRVDVAGPHAVLAVDVDGRQHANAAFAAFTRSHARP
jgi:thiamine biosynthesis lipoprotein